MKNNTLALGLIGIAVATLSIVYIGGCRRPAQIGVDPETHKVVDALFTAITARDAKLLDRCESDLASLHQADRLPESAHRSLAKIIARARAGQWQSAAEDLYPFIQGQQSGPETEERPVRKNAKR